MIEGLVVFLFLWLLVQVLLDKHQQVHLQVFLALALALLCFGLLLGCALCWPRRRRRPGRPAEEAQQPSRDLALPDLGPVLPPPTAAVPVQQGGALQPVGRPHVGSPPTAAPPRPAARASLPSLAVAPAQPRGSQRRSTIAAGEGSRLLGGRPVEGARMAPGASRRRPRPLLLHFAVGYSPPPEAALTVHVAGIAPSPGACYVEARLLPGSAEPQRTGRRRRSSLRSAFPEQLRFPGCSPGELRGQTLRLAVYAKAWARRKDAFVGEVRFPCARVAAAGEHGASLSVHAQELLLGQDVSPASCLSQPKSLGQIFLQLQYQALANRIKVLVRKAENLGRISWILGTPDHYVLIHLCHEGKIIDTKETKSIAGYNPVWNAPFLFSLPAGDIQEQHLSLEFTIMQARLYTRSCAVGRVLIGPVAPEMGQVHWKEMCSRGNLESARWHPIQSEDFQLCP